jgi:hypothetical protein
VSVSRLQLHMTNDARHYDLTVAVVEGGNLTVEMSGVDANGEQICELKGSPPAADLNLISRLLTTAATTLKSAAPDSPTLEQRRAKYGNSHRPWTAEDDQRLRELATVPGASIRALMQKFGRSRAAIEARLARLRIDADIPYQPPAEPDPMAFASLRRSHVGVRPEVGASPRSSPGRNS